MSLFTFSLRREITFFLGQVLDHSLDLVMALLRPGHKPAARGSAQPLRYLLALGHRVCLGKRHGNDMVHDICYDSTLDLNSFAMVQTSLGHLLHFWSVA